MTRKIMRDIPPKAWGDRCKYIINKLFRRAKLEEPFSIRLHDRFSHPSERQKTIESLLKKIVEGSNLSYGALLLLLCLLIVFIWGEKIEPVDKWVEFWGLIFDIFFILIVFEFFRQRLDRKSTVQRYKEIIEDYKCWDSEEAQFRIGGAIRRLKKSGVSSFDFSGWKVSGFDFKSHRIESIDGSTFFDDEWMNSFKPKMGYLKNIDFSYVSCREVVFSRGFFGGVISGLKIEDCFFNNCDLSGADFSSAQLVWNDKPPEYQYDVVDYEEDGQPILARVAISPFHEADLTGANFEHACFKNSDFRGVENVEKANFHNAKGLESCVFDSEDVKSRIIIQSNIG